MREIKFRAWDKKNKAWIYSDHTEGMAWFWQLLEKFDTKNFILMQYTGLKDKNGKEIYEGDMVKVEFISYPETENEKLLRTFVSPITYQDGFFAFSDGYDLHVPCQACFRVEIIGNIYENLELLDKK